ncbi:MAG: 16S rRNA (cytidine(1402)-2'-O)-methyltransferase [Actinomycetota bacterium]
MAGALVVVGTPIGNLGDLSPRAVEALAAADAIACEDTRRCRALLSHAGVEAPPMLVVNEHEERRRAHQVVERVAAGERVVLVSDAGMPAVSDPGQGLVAAVVEAGLAVEVVPGPTAMTTALVASGLPSGRFCFEGFLPRKGAARRERLEAVAAEPRTTVLYEAPHRLARTLADLAESAGGDRGVVVGRELTKLHEELWRGSLAEAAAWAAGRDVKGEVVLVLAGAPPAEPASDADVVAAVRAGLAAGGRTKDVAAAVARQLGVSKRRAYDAALEQSGD